MNNQPKYPDVKSVRVRARSEWERTTRRRIGIQERIGTSIPWWLVAIALAFFLLSAPHTAATFDRLTPGYGWVAPVAVEIALLYAAFMRRRMADKGMKISGATRTLEILVFLVAVIVNGAGSFISVVDSTGVQQLSFAALISDFGTLPATSQVALSLVLPAALIIPIGTSVAGEGIAALILERRSEGDLIEREWREVRIEVEFYALRDEAIRHGLSPSEAALWAKRITNVQPSEPKQIADSAPPVSNVSAVSVSTETGKNAKKVSPETQKVMEHFAANPDQVKRNHRLVAIALDVSPSTVYRVQKMLETQETKKSEI